jgi:hypothetical protein
MEQRPDRRRCRRLLSTFEALAGFARQLGRQLHHDRARLGSNAQREAAGPEHVQHAGVLGQHLGHERADPGLVRPPRELLEQQSRHAPTLELVRDDESDLGGVRAQPVVAAIADDPIVDAGDRDQRAVAWSLGDRPAMSASLEIGPDAREAQAA